MPGPLLAAVIGETSRKGFASGPLLTLGHCLLELFLIAALLLGLAPYLRKQGVFAAIALSGAVILLWMAFTMFRSLPTLSLSRKPIAARQGNLIFTGMVLSATSPYWFIWWATIGFGYILHSHQFGAAGLASFFSGHLIADLLWYSGVAGAVAGGRRFLSDRLYRGIIGCCASFLVLFAGYFFYSGLRGLIP